MTRVTMMAAKEIGNGSTMKYFRIILKCIEKRKIRKPRCIHNTFIVTADDMSKAVDAVKKLPDIRGYNSVSIRAVKELTEDEYNQIGE